MVLSQSGSGKAKQPSVGSNVAPERSKEPLELMFAEVKLFPYTVTGKGNVIGVTQSSQWLPVSVVPGTIGLPIVVEVV
jgi:hypothetical protein